MLRRSQPGEWLEICEQERAGLMSNEIERIRREYTKRDNSDLTHLYGYTNPAFLFHLQERERGLLRALRREGLDLSVTDVLEVGCGTGHILQRFLEFGARSAAGIDLMPNRVRIGRARYPTLRLILSDAGQLPFASESFGLAMQFMCLSSVLDSECRSRIAKEMWRILAPGGLILSYDLRPSSMLARSVNFVANYLSSAANEAVLSEPTPIKPLTIAELKALYPLGHIRVTSLSLNLNLAKVACLSTLFAEILSRLPPFRSHYLAVIRKPLNIDDHEK